MQRQSFGSVRVTYFDRRGVRRAAEEFAARLAAERPEVVRVVLFGSVARGDAVPGSDADFLVIISRSDKDFLDRMSDYRPDHFPVGVDVFPYTEHELQQMIREGNFFLRRALREGITLFERT
ncbi:MAG: nucleotidyltransferase domain-containing protein [Chloroflexi bacterium]|nr:nucleotidyltransferase domain-containing protein [Chloroflexota bacterium]